MTRKEDAPASPPRPSPARTRSAARSQRRCQQLGEAAANDAECLRVWAETRDRFLGRAGAARAAPHRKGGDHGRRRRHRQFPRHFTSYIDSGFGLLGGEVAFIATTLIVIDVTLAALFWSWGADDDIIARLVKKTLFVGVFAYLIGNWNNLAKIVFDSFAGLGLKASGHRLFDAPI
jgi:conjugative transfer region protein TrbK